MNNSELIDLIEETIEQYLSDCHGSIDADVWDMSENILISLKRAGVVK